MKLENQVVSLELAKKMKELGFEQESSFEWVVATGHACLTMDKDVRNSLFDERCFEGLMTTGDVKRYYSAYTVAELGEMLKNYGSNRMPYFCDQADSGWVHNFGAFPDYVKADTEADCRARMLIYLKENNLLN
jgi:hypothetical protein